MNVMNNHSSEVLLSTRDITKRYGSVDALAGVSLSIRPGESVAIMGPSGSGKSTLLHCLSGVLTPNDGSVMFGGRDISKMPDAARSHLRLTEFGFVFQDGQLVPELPTRENIALPLLLTGSRRKEALAKADDLLTKLGIGDLKNRRPSDMSGGQAQRVAIARALSAHPKVVFADEPSGALDQATGHEVMQLLTATARQTGAALVIVTHDPAVARWCSRLVEIRDGLIHADRFLDREAVR